LEDLERERESVARERDRSLALQEVSNKVAAAHDTDEVLDLIVNEAAWLLGTDYAFIRLLEGGVLVPSAGTDSVARYLADSAESQPTLSVGLGASAMGHVMASKNPLVFDDLSEEELITPAGRLTQQKHGFKAGALIPLLANDRSIGVLVVFDKRVRRFTDDEVSILTAFANQASLALEKARLLNEAETEKERAETERERSDALYRVSNLLAGAHDTDEVLDLIVNEAARLLKAPTAYVRLLEGGVLIPRAATESARRYLEDAVDEEPTLAVGESGGLVGHVMANQKPVVFEDISESEPLSKAGHIRTARHGIHGFMAVPLMANDRALGVLALMDTRIRLFTDDEVSLLSAFADQAALALEKARLLKEAETERERANSLYRISNLLAGAHDTDEVLNLIVNEAGRLLVAPSVKIRLLDGYTLGIPREHWKPREI
jgi:GAF domain-containing protein